MSLAAMHWASGQLRGAPPLKQGPRLALILLALEANATGYCRVRIEYLAERMGASVRSAQRATRALEQAGLLHIDERFEPCAAQLPNDYHLMMGA